MRVPHIAEEGDSCQEGWKFSKEIVAMLKRQKIERNTLHTSRHCRIRHEPQLTNGVELEKEIRAPFLRRGFPLFSSISLLTQRSRRVFL